MALTVKLKSTPKSAIKKKCEEQSSERICIVHSLNHEHFDQIKPITLKRWTKIQEIKIIRFETENDQERQLYICERIPDELDLTKHGYHDYCYNAFINLRNIKKRQSSDTHSKDGDGGSGSKRRKTETTKILFPASSNALNIAQLCEQELQRFNIDYKNMISFCSDNTAVMVGCLNGVTEQLRKKNSELMTVGCVCHLLDLAAKKAFNTLPVKIDELLMDIFYFLEPSDKRIREFKEYQLLHNDEIRKILKYCPTRWLSLGKCVNRLIELWVPLKAFVEDCYKQEKAKADKKAASVSQKQSAEAGINEKVTLLGSNFQRPKGCPAAHVHGMRAIAFMYSSILLAPWSCISLCYKNT